MTHATVKAEFLSEHSTPLTRCADDEVAVVPAAIIREAANYAEFEREAAYLYALDAFKIADPLEFSNTSWRVGNRWVHTLDELVRELAG